MPEARCEWCKGTVINPVQKPNMVIVGVDTGSYKSDVWQICLECYAELIKLIARVGRRREITQI